MLAGAAAATFFTAAPLQLELSDAAAATGFALPPLPLLLVQSATQMYTVPQPLPHPITYRVWGPGARGDGVL